MAISSDLTGLEGVYKWSYAGGSFTVELRPYGNFYCKDYGASATWSISADLKTHEASLTIDWKKYGKYEMQVPIATAADLTCLKQTCSA